MDVLFMSQVEALDFGHQPEIIPHNICTLNDRDTRDGTDIMHTVSYLLGCA